MVRFAFVLLTTIQSIAQIPQDAPKDDISDALAHAEALYYGARFNESIALLTRIDDALKTQPARLQEKINTKLRLALAHIGLNDTAKAKSLLIDVYALDPDFALDTGQFPPKVIAVAAEAKTEQTKIRCQAAQEDARAYLESAKAAKLIDLLRSSKSKCAGLAVIESEAAEAFYKNGLAAYRRNEFSTALSNFEAVLALSPENELPLQYIDLIQSKLQLGQDRLLLQWQRNFDARHLTAAAADYRQMKSFNEGRGSSAISHVNDEYRKALSNLVETWNRTCSSGDSAAMSAVRNQISELLPEPSFGEDIRARMIACPPPDKIADTAAEVKIGAAVNPDQGAGTATDAPANRGCLEMQPQLALTRLKTRVDPVIPGELRYYLKSNAQVVVRAKTRISENGDVAVTGMTEGNPILNNVVRNAVVAWKFVPIRDNTGPRCVETEISIVIKLAQ
jgi:tetratricopeptide (TPR) repeat protein